MSFIEDYENTINSMIDSLNNEPTLNNFLRVESSLDFYSDCFKDEWGFRPDLSKFRNKYNDDAKKVQDEFESMPNKWEVYNNYMRGNK